MSGPMTRPGETHGASPVAIRQSGGGSGPATEITVADTTDPTCWVLLVESQTGDLEPKSDGGLTYNAATGTLTPTNLTTGVLTATAGIFTALVIGTGGAGVDYALNFDGETNDGVLTWMEDEDYFRFSDGVLFNTAEELYFRATTQRIYSSAADTLDIDAPTLRLNPNNAGDIVLGDSTERDMYPQTDLKINLGGASNRFNEAWLHELHVQQSVANVSNPPTDAELDSAFGTPASLGRGFVGTVDDADSDTTLLFWLCITSDASWYYVPMTKAT